MKDVWSKVQNGYVSVLMQRWFRLVTGTFFGLAVAQLLMARSRKMSTGGQ